jgi:hypothetical protein
MFGILHKPAWMLTLLAGAVAIPYLLSRDGIGPSVREALAKATSREAREGKGNDDDAPPACDVSAAATAQAAAPSSLPLPPLCDLESAFRFDIHPQWVTETWPHVTTVLADGDLAGMRVPLVSGLMPDDLVGSLTYYFDEERRLQKITFAGSTGDVRRLVALMTSRFGVKSQPTTDAGLYQTQWNGQPISTIRIRHAPIVSAAAPHGRFDITLELKRADETAGIGGPTTRLLGW